MKKLLFLILSLLVLTNCKKDEENNPSKINKLAGTYEGQTCVFFTDCKEESVYLYDVNDTVIDIKIKSDKEIEIKNLFLKIYKNEKLENYLFMDISKDSLASCFIFKDSLDRYKMELNYKDLTENKLKTFNGVKK